MDSYSYFCLVNLLDFSDASSMLNLRRNAIWKPYNDIKSCKIESYISGNCSIAFVGRKDSSEKECFFVSLTVEPKGHRQSRPILNVCIAKGMPMMVHARARLPVK